MNRIAVKGDAGSLLEALPWLVVLILLAVASGSTFLLPMEMRGSALGGETVAVSLQAYPKAKVKKD